MAKNKGKGKASKAANKTKSTTSNRNLPLPDAPPPPRECPGSDHTQKREPLTQLSSAQANVAAEHKNTRDPKDPNPAMMKRVLYQSEHSVARLKRDGFDYRVTDLSPQQVVEQWSKTAETQSFKSLIKESGPLGHKTRKITSAPLTLTSEFCITDRQRIDLLLPTPVPEGLERHDNVQPETANDDKDSAIGSDVASHAGPKSTTSNEAPDHVITKSSTSDVTDQSDAGDSTSSQESKFSDDFMAKQKTLDDILRIPELGSAVLEEVFATGFHSVQKLAMTSLKYLGLVRSLLVIMDCTGGGLASLGAEKKMLLAVTPEVTIEDFRCARDRDPLGLHDFNFIKGWCEEALKEEAQVVRDLGAIACRKRLPFRIVDSTVKIIRTLSMKWDDDIFTHRRIVRGEDDEIWQPTYQREARNLQKLLAHLYERKATIAHVHFHEVPLLDRRVLAMILRACPNITTVSVDACPLLHIGDLLPIIDEIHAINAERNDASKITSLNFGPIYERGMPVAKEGFSATYGLTWDPLRFDTSQVGVYAILLKAFFKASAMGLTTLFDKDGALMHFLCKLPLDPLGVPIFLDACYRLKHRLADTDNPNDLQLRKIVYDMLRVVRIGFSWPEGINASMDFFNGTMMNNKKYCTCCGYRLLEAFFYPLNHVSDDRTCYGCMLQDELDAQSHHLRDQKIKCLDILFPDHKPQAIGHEAPMLNNPLLKLESMLPADPTLPTVQLNSQNGDIETRLDPKKRRIETRASLMGIWPNLALFGSDDKSKKVWGRFFAKCHQMDMARTAAAMFWDAFDDGKVSRTQASELMGACMPRCRPDHRLELQLGAPRGMTVNTHAEAKQNHIVMVANGEMPGTAADLLSEEEQVIFGKAQEASFW